MPHILSVDAAVFDVVLGQPFQGEVHSVFSRAINFADRVGGFYGMVAAEADDAPATLRIRLPDGTGLDGLGISPGDRVVSVPGGLAVGKALVSAGQVRRWAAALPPFPRRQGRLASNLAALRRVAAAEGAAGGLRAFIAREAAGSVMEEALAERAAAVAAALAAADAGAVRSAGLRLIGLGAGLTPSGDDFLAGVMVVFCMDKAGYGAEYREMAAQLAAGAATGAVSRALLAHAAAGRASAGVLALLAALGEGGADEVKAAARRVMAVGATSGTDIIAGLLAGLAAAPATAGKEE